ncbi:MAG TPA: RRXRR domain-containing protein, partial [Ktedonobacterales bacterium]|nr:RRXRR domain-containing protein [Ktedonobacterales bacterium]
MAWVFVVDQDRRPLNPMHPGEARRLLTPRNAAVWRRSPFTIILTRAVPNALVALLRVKIDPGSSRTGLALVNDTAGQVVWAAELAHRGDQVKDRRARRRRRTRYRPARFANRRRREGWLPSSLESRIQNVLTWVVRLRRFSPIGAIS